MDKQPLSIKDFVRGKIIRHKGTGNSYVIDGNYGAFAIAVKTITVNNPDEWIIVEPKS